MLDDVEVVLKCGELFFVGRAKGDKTGENASGLYFRDMRHLSRLELIVEGINLTRLGTRAVSGSSASVIDANETGRLSDGSEILARTISVEQHLNLTDALQVTFALRNFTSKAITLSISLQISADFRDLFDIRGQFPPRRGRLELPSLSDQSAELSYTDATGSRLQTIVRFSQTGLISIATVDGHPKFSFSPSTEQPDVMALALPTVVASFAAEVDPGDAWELGVVVVAVSTVGLATEVEHDDPMDAPSTAVVQTSDPMFDRFLQRNTDDLAMLWTCFPTGCMPAAGIPWYVAPFGRDSLIVGLQTLHAAPQSAVQTLRTLACLQGTRVDIARGEEPGKIPHELRYGELARSGAVPHTPYYGSLDATPLFVLLFAETVAWTGDEGLYRELLPNVTRAVEWIQNYGDLDGDGLVEYQYPAKQGNPLSHPVWKDSWDSLNHADGKRPAPGPIAPVEVEGYVFAAYDRLADLAVMMGEASWASALSTRANQVREVVEFSFWMEAEEYYSQALDSAKKPFGVISSNAAHLLYCGLPFPQRAAAIAHRLAQNDMDSGWGIRTLSSAMATYNPMSYHNGSIWPHDNSLIVAGLHRFGHHDLANRIALAMFQVSTTDPLFRLQELYCGFGRSWKTADAAPVPYPVSCSPQAWAAASAQLLIRSMLGLRIDLERGLLVTHPALPDWLDEIKITGMQVHGVSTSIDVSRVDGGYRLLGVGPVQGPVSSSK